MPEFVVILETTGPDGEPWEQVLSPHFTSEVGAAAWRKENKLPDHCRIRPVAGIANEAKALLTGPVQESLNQKWQKGDVQALLEAVQKYGYFHEPLPLWCWSAVHDAALKLSMYEARDLNEAFGFDTKGRGRLKDRNKQAQLQWQVFIICEELRNKGRPVSPDMFDEAAETAGERFGATIGKTTAEKYYYAVKKELESLLLPASG
ncbi:hypothetical protein ACP86_05970 [Marinobacter sp. CP1]|jgi:hypothetical protein|uniref:hypothetical protein n=1 Tax=unclassified Marinobacter TaxID=83889 RepID=UPI00069EDA7C|nr:MULTISPECIES: hypothetical protein [unclassified Marinobacter]AKV95745.1 hypothetical protein ACP86_05970 [Marinobacter sp. CP1]